VIGIIDYGAGNLFSLQRALRHLGRPTRLVGSELDWSGLRGVILPGVGSFAAAMSGLRQKKLEKPLQDWLGAGRPFLGICLGLQLLFSGSAESPQETGLDFFAGRCSLFEQARVPQLGWNRVSFTGPHFLWQGIADHSFFYYANSYHAPLNGGPPVLGRSTHGRPFPAALAAGEICAVQFHPEKSAEPGLRLLANWSERCRP